MTQRAQSQRGHVFQRREAQHFCCRVPVDILFRGSSSRRGQSQRSVFNPSTQGSMQTRSAALCFIPAAPGHVRASGPAQAAAESLRRHRRPLEHRRHLLPRCHRQPPLRPLQGTSQEQGDHVGTASSWEGWLLLLRGEVGPGGLKDNPAAAWCVPAAP